MRGETKLSDESIMDNQLQPDYANAVDVQQVYKTFGGKKDGFSVLKGLNLSVPYGTIYGLLGPSGCGKTTLLRCIIGKVSIDSGTITVFGGRPDPRVSGRSMPRVGFMPQDYALCNTLLVTETIQFYGRIAGMDESKIEARGKFLLSFLNIDNASEKLIGNLSGGQKRRVSMAIALLHEPELLILDEPTVGVDPVLRASIWEYLNFLMNVKEKPVTIMITTHYIEEAALANNVGLMLHGRLLAQSPPGRLMQTYGCLTLEEVFLKLCLDNKNNNPDVIDNDDQCLDGKTAVDNQQLKTSEKPLSAGEKRGVCNRKPRQYRHSSNLPRWYRVKALFWKDVKFFLRHIGLFILELLLPSSIIIVFAISVGRAMYGLPVGIVNDDINELGLSFINSINKNTVTQVMYENYTEAQEDAKNGKIIGVIHLNNNFTESVLQRFQHGIVASDSAFDHSLVGVTLDWTNQQSAYTITNELLLGYTKFVQTTLVSMRLNPMAGGIPLKYADVQVYGSIDRDFSQFLFPGFFLCETFFLAMGLTAVSISSERLSGNMERIMITGAEIIEIILGHMFAHLALMMVQLAFTFLVAFVFFQFLCEGSYLLVAALAIVQGVCGMYLGFLLSMAFATETMMLMCSIGLLLFGILSEGFLWPLESLTFGFKVVCLMQPQTWAVEGMRAILNRGWGLSYTPVLAGFGMSLMWTALFLTAGLIVSRRKL